MMLTFFILCTIWYNAIFLYAIAPHTQRLDGTISLTFYENKGLDINVSEWDGGRFNIVSPQYTDMHILTSRYDADIMAMWYSTNVDTDPISHPEETINILISNSQIRYRCYCGPDQESTLVITIDPNDNITPVQSVNCWQEIFTYTIDMPILECAQQILYVH